MRIVVDQSGYSLLNMGDLAMLQTAIVRLQKLWPESHISVLTDDPQRLSTLCLGVQPLHISGRYMFFDRRALFGPLYRLAPKLDQVLRQSSPRLAQKTFALRKRLVGQDPQYLNDFVEAVRNADLVIASGGGYLTDAFPLMVHSVHQTFLLAKLFDKPMALLGQGIGPLKDVALKEIASEVLLGAKIIALREGRIGPKLLKEMGVDKDRIKITGDDAIEMAFEERHERMGDGIGVNLRVAYYAALEPETISVVRNSLQSAVDRYHAPLIPIPISFYHNGEDAKSIQELLLGIDNDTDGGINLATPQAVIRQISRCRVVVTGSYHAAVFALAQGIPVVGLANSDYYVDKFLGLAEQFGIGCEVVLLNAPDVPQRLNEAIDQSWRNVEETKVPLLQAASRQIMAGRAVYSQLHRSILS